MRCSTSVIYNGKLYKPKEDIPDVSPEVMERFKEMGILISKKAPGRPKKSSSETTTKRAPRSPKP